MHLYVTNSYTIISLTVPAIWIAFIISVVVTILLLWWRFSKRLASFYSDCVVTFLIVWKLSIIVTDFQVVVSQPLSILYFTTGAVSICLGIIAVAVNVLRDFRNGVVQLEDLPALLASVIVMQGVYQLFVVLLNDNTYWQELLTVIVFAIIGIVVVLKLRVSENWGQQIALFFVIGHIFVALMQPKGILQPSLLSSVLFITLYFIIPYWERMKQEIHITEENK